MVAGRITSWQWLGLALVGVAIVCVWYALAARHSAARDEQVDAAVQSDSGTSAPTEKQLSALGVELSPVEPASSIFIEGLPAEVIAPLNGSARVAAPFAGVVTRVLADDGQDVIAGQSLVRIQSRELLAAVADAARARSESVLANQASRRDAQLLAEGIIPASRSEASAARSTIADAVRQQAAGALSGLRTVADGAPGEYDLLSPIAGRVLHRSVNPGQSLAALDETFSIALPGSLDLELNVPIELRAQLQTGLTVVMPDDSEATVVSIGGNTERTSQSLRLRARLADASAWVAGQHLLVTLKLPVPEGSWKVRAAALLPRGDRVLLIVKQNESFRRIDVEQLGSDHEWAVVRAPLEPGMTVVSRGAGALLSTLPEQ